MLVQRNIPIDMKYVVKEKVGQGANGAVYRTFDMHGRYYAAKFALRNSVSIAHEYRIMRVIEQYATGHDRIVCAHYYGRHFRRPVVVMDLLGHSLKEHCRHTFSLKTLGMIAIQILDRLETVHKAGVVHGDIKPSNIVTGRGSRYKTLYLIDHGASKFYIDCNTGEHREETNMMRRVGTPLFSSSRWEEGRSCCRKDDLESLCYTLIFLGTGTLPWFNETNREEVTKMKKFMAARDICHGLDGTFEIILKGIRRIQYREKPNYSYFRILFKAMLLEKDLTNDARFDWIPGSLHN